MKAPPAALSRAPLARPSGRRGAALMLSFLVLLVIAAIVWQINVGTATDARVTHNEVGIAQMDYAIESALLEVFEKLAADGEADSSAGGGGPGGIPGGGGGSGGQGGGSDPLDALGGGSGGSGGPIAPGGPGAPGGSNPSDSREDEWASLSRTDLNGIELRVLVQDEDGKYNLLALLTENEDEREKAFDRLVRILDSCREGTEADIDGSRSRSMAEAIRDHLQDHLDPLLPRPELATDVDEPSGEANPRLPLSLREFVALEPFVESDFRDFRDAEGTVVHSIGSFLTVWTSIATRAEVEQAKKGGAGGGPKVGPGAPGGPHSLNPNVQIQSAGGPGSGGSGGGQGGGGIALPGQGQGPGGGGGGAGTSGGGTAGVAVNVNTAPPVVLKCLFDHRDVDPRFWDGVIQYRNEEDETKTEDSVNADVEPLLDEYGREIVPHKIFDSLEKLAEIDGWENLEPIQQAEIKQLLTVQSGVFSIYVTARRVPESEAGAIFAEDADEIRERDEAGGALERTVRCVVWRRTTDDGIEIVPLERWEVIDYSPYAVLDFPDEDR